MIADPKAASVSDFAALLEQAFASGSAADLFEDGGLWRDLAFFTWNIRTLEGRDEIRAMLTAQTPGMGPISVRPDPETHPSGDSDVTLGWLLLETPVARGRAVVRLRNGRIWTLLTTLEELVGFEEMTGVNRPKGVTHGQPENRLNWTEQRAAEVQSLGHDSQPYVVIIGGGQGGIALAARLRQLDVPTIVVEKTPRPGDNWRGRYKSLCLHDPVWYDHMPYIPFPPNWPVFTPKDKLGDWLEFYVSAMELNFWGSTECVGARFDDRTGTWDIRVRRGGKDVVLRPRQLVLATGMAGKMYIPDFEGQDVFAGEQQHSSQHAGPAGWGDKKVVIIGANNSAHDICAALAEVGSDVTMVQRSSTLIARSETLQEVAWGPLYSERAVRSGVTTERADLIAASVPFRLMPVFQKPVMDRIREIDSAYYKRLEKAGYMLDYGEDGTGLSLKYLRRGSGYYIDVGACELVIRGAIKLRSRVNVSRLVPEGVELDSGEVLPADLVVYATGFGSMNGWAADLIGQDVADRVGKVWGFGSDTTKDPGPWEGELRNMWKPTRQPNLWFHGGNLAQSRFYSRYLALQLKARMEGLDTPVYGLPETRHLT